MFQLRPILALAGVAIMLAWTIAEADARSRGSFGSRGVRTFSAPPPTATAPTRARPVERSITQPGQPAAQRQAMPRAAAAQPAAGGLFNRPGLMGGLLAGFLGAGLFGLLAGQGLFGNLAGLASFLGLLLQVGLIAMVGWFLFSLWRRRNTPEPAFAGAAAGSARPLDLSATPDRGGAGTAQATAQRYDIGNLPPAGPTAPTARYDLGGAASETGAAHDEIGVTGQDLDTFERMLGEIQEAFGREDLAVLRRRLTPEMVSYFSEDLAANVSRGVENRISGIKLLQGDLAEAWNEGEFDYATVAMRYEIVDWLADRTSGELVDGSQEPVEAVEYWTFVRARGGNWLLSAIQQADE